MTEGPEKPGMTLAEFLRIFPMRAQRLMWFLGAGASAAAGVPTAYHMVWDFKRSLYCSAQHVSLKACSDLSSPVLRARLQAHFDSTGTCPPLNSPEEYAYYFEAAYPSEADRRRYIEQSVSSALPSYGHVALAAFLKLGMSRIVWTANFDRALEDAIIEVFGGSAKLVVATPETARTAPQAISEERWPFVGKLHGDFHSRRLKNTSEELRAQDALLRETLVDCCRRHGLIVVGYSGRDDSVMDALQGAIADGKGFPSGLFWFHRSEHEPLPRVSGLIEAAKSSGVDAHLIAAETFDELLADMLLLIQNLPDEIATRLDRRAMRLTPAPIPSPAGSWPVIRMNALPIKSWPVQCRRVVCTIGGAREVKDVVAQTGADVIAARRNVGVLAFGTDNEVRKAFQERNITEFDLHNIDAARLRYESAERGLLYASLARALGRERGLRIMGRRTPGFLAFLDPDATTDKRYAPLRGVVEELAGAISMTTLKWSEAVSIRLEYRLSRLFLLFEPTVWAESVLEPVASQHRAKFIRERLRARYNSESNALFEAWSRVLVGDADEAELRAFGCGDGVDAVFCVSRTTGFSRRGR